MINIDHLDLVAQVLLPDYYVFRLLLHPFLDEKKRYDVEDGQLSSATKELPHHLMRSTMACEGTWHMIHLHMALIWWINFTLAPSYYPSSALGETTIHCLLHDNIHSKSQHCRQQPRNNIQYLSNVVNTPTRSTLFQAETEITLPFNFFWLAGKGHSSTRYGMMYVEYHY